MKKICLLLLVSLMAVVSAYGRQKTEEERSVQPFSTVNIVGGLNVVYEQGNSYKVRLVGSADAVDAVDVKVSGSSLNIQNKNVMTRTFGDVYVEMTEDPKAAEATVYVTAPDVKVFNLAGSGTLRTEKIASGAVTFNLAGSGQIDIKRLSADNASFCLAGSGKMDLDNLRGKSVNLTISGSGYLKANVAEASSLSCSAVGTGKISVSGNVDRYAKSTIGGGTVSDSALTYQKITESTISSSGVYKRGDGSGATRSEQPRTVDGIVVNP